MWTRFAGNKGQGRFSHDDDGMLAMSGRNRDEGPVVYSALAVLSWALVNELNDQSYGRYTLERAIACLTCEANINNGMWVEW